MDYIHIAKKTQMVWVHADSQNKRLQEKPMRTQQKRAVKTLRGGQLLTWHRATERDLNSNYNTKDAITKTRDSENYSIIL